MEHQPFMMHTTIQQSDSNVTTTTNELPHIDIRFNFNKEIQPPSTTSNNTTPINDFFEDPKIIDLFNLLPNQSVIDCLYHRINILNEVIEDESGINKYVEHHDDMKLTMQQLQNLNN